MRQQERHHISLLALSSPLLFALCTPGQQRQLQQQIECMPVLQDLYAVST